MDKFSWLKDVKRQSRKVIEFLKTENERTEEFFKKFGLDKLKERIYNEIISMIEDNYETYPYEYGNYLYYERYEEGKEFPILMRSKYSSTESEVLLDWNEIANKYSVFYPGGWKITKNGRFLAFSYDTRGDETFTLYMKDTFTGEIREVHSVYWDEFLFNEDGELFFVMETEDTKRPYKVLKYSFDKNSFEEVFRDDEPYYFVSIYSSLDGYIFVSSGNTESNIVELIYPYRRKFYERKKGVKYFVQHGENGFYVLTNEDAPDYKVVFIDERTNSEAVFIPEMKGRPIEEIRVFKNFIAILEREEGLQSIRIYYFDKDEFYRLKFKQPAYTVRFAENYEYNPRYIRLIYSSLTTPDTIYYFYLNSRRLVRKWTKPVPHYNPKDYKVERIWVTSYDGTKVPITIAYNRRKFKRDGNHPILLVGYGAYGYPYDTPFSLGVISLMKRGIAYAVAHIRGGGEFGELWHKQGKFLNKKNTIYDFVECAEYLIVNRWTSKGKIGIMGASAGGITIGGALNLKPYLFGVAVAMVPFVDVLNTMMDETLPLTIQEYDEWGNPNEKEFYDYIKSYSPYDNVKPQKYPPVLAMGGFYDPRVGYWEPSKWVLKLRENNLSNNPILLYISMDEGHVGKLGRYEAYKETAMRYAFILKFLKTKL